MRFRLVDLQGHIKAEGSLNFGRATAQQLFSNVTAVTLHTSSGVITTAGAALAAQNFSLASFIVYNHRVKASSTVLVTLENGYAGLTTGTIPYAVVSNILNGQFTITVFNIGATTNDNANPIQIGFLIC